MLLNGHEALGKWVGRVQLLCVSGLTNCRLMADHCACDSYARLDSWV